MLKTPLWHNWIDLLLSFKMRHWRASDPPPSPKTLPLEGGKRFKGWYQVLNGWRWQNLVSIFLFLGTISKPEFNKKCFKDELLKVDSDERLLVFSILKYNTCMYAYMRTCAVFAYFGPIYPFSTAWAVYHSMFLVINIHILVFYNYVTYYN